MDGDRDRKIQRKQARLQQRSQEIDELFAVFDMDGDGKLTGKELKWFIAAPRDQEWFEIADADEDKFVGDMLRYDVLIQDKVLTLQNFRELMVFPNTPFGVEALRKCLLECERKKAYPTGLDTIDEIFAVFDIDGDGKLTGSELKWLLAGMNSMTGRFQPWSAVAEKEVDKFLTDRRKNGLPNIGNKAFTLRNWRDMVESDWLLSDEVDANIKALRKYLSLCAKKGALPIGASVPNGALIRPQLVTAYIDLNDRGGKADLRACHEGVACRRGVSGADLSAWSDGKMIRLLKFNLLPSATARRCVELVRDKLEQTDLAAFDAALAESKKVLSCMDDVIMQLGSSFASPSTAAALDLVGSTLLRLMQHMPIEEWFTHEGYPESYHFKAQDRLVRRRRAEEERRRIEEAEQKRRAAEERAIRDIKEREAAAFEAKSKSEAAERAAQAERTRLEAERKAEREAAEAKKTRETKERQEQEAKAKREARELAKAQERARHPKAARPCSRVVHETCYCY